MFKNEGGGAKGRLNNVQKNRRFGPEGRPLVEPEDQWVWSIISNEQLNQTQVFKSLLTMYLFHLSRPSSSFLLRPSFWLESSFNFSWALTMREKSGLWMSEPTCSETAAWPDWPSSEALPAHCFSFFEIAHSASRRQEYKITLAVEDFFSHLQCGETRTHNVL